MSVDEIFYDSLDENSEDNEESCLNKIPQDLSTTVPLYTGDISKKEILIKKKKNDKSSKPIIYPNKPKKSYLEIYHEKKNLIEKKSIHEIGNITSRATCEKLSPKRAEELDSDLKEINNHYENNSDSDQNQFYEKFMALELEKKSTSVISLTEKNKKPKLTSRSVNLKSSSERQFCLKFSKIDTNEKLELLRKRQSYGIKMSMKNRIKLEEIKSLKKIKNSNLIH